MAQPTSRSGIPRLLSSDEAAEVLAVCTKTLLTLARRGEIPGIRVGVQWKFELTDLQEWIRRRKTGTLPPNGA